MNDFDTDLSKQKPLHDDKARDPAETTAQAFLEQIKEFSEELDDGLRMAINLPPLGPKKLFVNQVSVRLPQVICVSGVDEDGYPFCHICHHSAFAAHLSSYRVS